MFDNTPPNPRDQRQLHATRFTLHTAITPLLALACLIASPPGSTAQIVPPQAQSAPANAPSDPAVKLADDQSKSAAEIVVKLQRIIESNQKELDELKAKLETPNNEFAKAEADFQDIDQQLNQKKESLRKAQDAGMTDQAEAILKEVDSLSQAWKLAKDRFDLSIRERKTINERIDILQKSLVTDQMSLNKLLGNDAKSETPETPTTTNPPPNQPAATPETLPATSQPAPTQNPSPTPAPAPASEPAPATAPPALPTLAPGLITPGTTPQNEAESDPKKAVPPSAEVVKAQEKVQETARAVGESEEEARSIEDRITRVDRLILLQREMLDTSIQKNANADTTRETLAKQYRNQVDAGAGAIELRPLRLKIDEAEERLAESRADIKDRMQRLQELQDEQALYISARNAARRDTDQMRAQLEEAQKNLKKASNPFSFENLKRRTVESGPVVLGILIAMFVLQWLVNLSGRRIVKLMANQGARGARQEREDRANTLVSVFGNFATLAIFIGGGMMILDEVGIPIGPLLGGAAVVGFAIGFGAQNLVRDYFSGFMILLENQYKLKDVVKIGDHAGSVEQITMRMTALRDLEGNLHFLPNGEIKSVINMSHGWSRALFDIGVAYKENVDHVMNVILEVGQDLRQDKKFRLLILEDPTMLGVDAFGDSAVIIKFFIKTLPLKQWDVKREMLRRLKNRFDQLGIEIPFPQRTIHHQTDNDQLLEALANQTRQDPYQNHPG